ncbi:TetR/AcrR family transcriptional regulator [Bacteroidota bacterium]
MGIQERKERERQQRREDIVDAAEKIFFEKGIENATMDDVANEAELSKGTLYLYFKSKAELHFAICVRGLIILKEAFIKVVDPKKTAIDNLLEIGRAYVQFAKSFANYFKIMMHFEGADEEACEGCPHEHSHKDDVMGYLNELFDIGKKEGSIRKDIKSNVLAHLVWSQTTGVLQFAATKKIHLDMRDISEDEIIQSHMELILDGIKPTNTQ